MQHNNKTTVRLYLVIIIVIIMKSLFSYNCYYHEILINLKLLIIRKLSMVSTTVL